MKNYCIIPARSGSKGVPDKNILDLSGFPVLAYSIMAGRMMDDIEKVWVTTDSLEYAEIALKYRASAMMRPDYLCWDSCGDYDYLLHAIYYLEMKLEDNIILLRPTTPLRKIDMLNTAWELWEDFRYIGLKPSLRSMHALSEPPEKMFKFTTPDDNLIYGHVSPYMDNKVEDTNLGRQNFGDCLHPNGYIDIINVGTLVRTSSAYSDQIYGFKTERVIEIDEKQDFELLSADINTNSHEIHAELIRKFKK